jgi:spore coat polysaccharide biosynthesis protein SpsF (cytidylyltransferase family)/2-polyprenyl-3-methyl-5-hydroxy-6-metoxy-1,4-benzoquinol methylase/spore coat polysaccharide biosynthesis predicted glycosyltransferase SpsG
MTAVIVQCRLSSTRLPEKALKDLGGKPVLAWTLDAMKKVKADAYYVATDEASFERLAPVAEKCGWNIFAGPLEDVLARFCMVIRRTDADTVLRATADNPFLFYEAAQSLLDEYRARCTFAKCDYITWTGLPHGSGVEVFNAQSLLESEKLTSSAYDHEHVGPALYNHRNRFSALMVKAPARFYYPDYRTTIDTPADYRRALAIVRCLSGGKAPSEPYTTEQILSVMQNPGVTDPVLYVPSVKAGRGTGHLRRCLKAASETGATVLIPSDADLAEIPEAVEAAEAEGLADWQIVHEMPEKGEYSLIAADCFSLDQNTALRLHECATLAGIDDGSPYTDYCDYLLDIIPSYGLSRKANTADPSFMQMPEHRRSAPACASGHDVKKILICLGGEDPANLSVPAARAFAGEGRTVTAVVPSGRRPSETGTGIFYIDPVPVLRETLYRYDLVVTHYGLTAYEAACAGCAVVLLATTPLHASLAQKYGFVCLKKNELTAKNCSAVLHSVKKLYPKFSAEGGRALGPFVAALSRGRRLSCPVCGNSDPRKSIIAARTPQRTFRRCLSCGMVYMAWTADAKQNEYDTSYFAEQYKNQYGKTYLEDFETIKAQGRRRIAEMNCVMRKVRRNTPKPSVLDIGCAYGPFLSAAADDGWQVFGTDISQDAVSYVQTKLLFPAACASFPDFDAAGEFGMQQFDAVTMWYVIEHFRNLAPVLRSVSSLVKEGGIFAFSTPSGEGVSAKMRTDMFFAQSPADHYTIWEPSAAGSVLKKFGFEVVKIVSTGHHPERFPQVEKHGWKKGSPMYRMYEYKSRMLHLGDTFEVYCRRTGK